MKKALTLLFLLLILTFTLLPCAVAADDPFDIHYNFALRTLTGESVYHDTPYQPQQLSSGVRLEVSNGNSNTVPLLLFVIYRGQLIPFATDNDTPLQISHAFTLPGDSEVSLDIYPDAATLQSLVQGDAFVTIALAVGYVGHPDESATMLPPLSPTLDKCWLTARSNAVSSEVPPTARYDEQGLRLAQSPIFFSITAVDGVATHDTYNLQSSSAEPVFSYHMEGSEILHYLSEDTHGQVLVIPILNGELCAEHCLTIPAIGTNQDGTFTLPLQPGENQLGFVVLPLSDTGFLSPCWGFTYFVQNEVTP